MESKIYQEKKEVDRLDNDIRQATTISQKNYQDLQKLSDSNYQRDSENRANKGKLESMEIEIE